MVEKCGKIAVKAVDIFFLALMCGIFLATLLVDKNIKVSFPNTVKYANGGYYMFAAVAILAVLYVLYKTRGREIEKRTFYGMLFGMVIVVAFFEWRISGWVYDFFLGGNFESVR